MSPRPLPGLRISWTDPATGTARSLPLEGAVRIGSSRQNDVVLSLRSVEPFHAEILANPAGGWDLVAVTPRGLNVGGRMTAHARLLPGTEFSVGSVGFRTGVPDDQLWPAEARRRSGAAPKWETPPAAPGSADAARGPLAAVAAVVILGVAGVAAWSHLALRAPEKAARVAAPAPAPAPARRATAPPPLEAGDVPLAAADDVDGAATVLVRMGTSTVPVRGFFVSAGGLLVTTRRILLRADSFSVKVAGTAAPVAARLVASDADHDLALLLVPVEAPVSVAPLDDDDAMRAPAFAVGASPSEVRAFVASNR